MISKIEELSKLRIAYVRQTGPYGPANAQAMEKLKGWADANRLLNESAILFGVPLDNPQTTAPNDCRYDACIVVAADYPINDDCIDQGELPGGKYFIVTVEHTAEAIGQAWAEIIPALRSNGYQIDNQPILERYTGEMLANELCEICVPVRPL